VSNFPLKIVGAGTHGKFIFVILEKEYSLWSTLGMTGNWSTEKTKHTRLTLKLDDGEIYFNDQRNFGTIKLVRGKYQLIEKLQSFGPDLLTQDTSDDEFINCLRKKDKWPICKTLMDQSVVAGVGNYIKSDCLWLSRISPHAKVQDISNERLVVLKNAITQIMKESLRMGGASMQNYMSFEGKKGLYTQKFLAYSRDCDNDGNKLIREKTPDGRTTYWCPEIQF